jgi:hypothetical protein
VIDILVNQCRGRSGDGAPRNRLRRSSFGK